MVPRRPPPETRDKSAERGGRAEDFIREILSQLKEILHVTRIKKCSKLDGAGVDLVLELVGGKNRRFKRVIPLQVKARGNGLEETTRHCHLSKAEKDTLIELVNNDPDLKNRKKQLDFKLDTSRIRGFITAFKRRILKVSGDLKNPIEGLINKLKIEVQKGRTIKLGINETFTKLSFPEQLCLLMKHSFLTPARVNIKARPA